MIAAEFAPGFLSSSDQLETTRRRSGAAHPALAGAPVANDHAGGTASARRSRATPWRTAPDGAPLRGAPRPAANHGATTVVTLKCRWRTSPRAKKSFRSGLCSCRDRGSADFPFIGSKKQL